MKTGRISVEQIILHNRAPFEHLELRFEDGVNVLSGVNGRGKTTILSYIADAFYEMARANFSNSFEGREDAYYRISSGLETIDVNQVSFVYIRFKVDLEHVDYIDIRGEMTKEEYSKLVQLSDPMPWHEFSGIFNQSQGKQVQKNKNKLIKDVFKHSVVTYFPAYRTDVPAYINEKYKTEEEFHQRNQYVGYLTNPIEVVDNAAQLSSWILDVVLDWELYKKVEIVPDEHGNTMEIDKSPEFFIWRSLSNILAGALIAKYDGSPIRFGIGRRYRGSRVSVLLDNSDGKEKQLSPSIYHLSSGERELLGIFGEILRQGDMLQPNVSADNIMGIVVVDEIDKHLHIRSQKESLPTLLNMFPNTQFIVTSHSPFFNMGLAETCNRPCQIIDLDASGVVCEPRNNELYQQVYELMLGDQTNFAKQLNELQEQLNKMKMPLVITEGKTDIKHIEKARKQLGICMNYDTIAPNSQPDGDGDLLKLLQNLARTPQAHKVIGIFDCDSKTTKDIIAPYKDFGNNVYAFKIESPANRVANGQTEISIEYLYTDDEIRTELPNHTRLYFGTDFSERTGRCKLDDSLSLANQSDRGKDKIVENCGGQAVYDGAENNYLAKKEDFASAIENDLVNVSEASWENFRHIFDKIEAIAKL